MSAESVYTPSKWGRIFHNLPHDEAMGAGSAGPGKTLVLIHDPIQSQAVIEHDRCYRAMDHPFPLRWGESLGWALHLRREMTMLQSTIVRMHRIFPKIDPKAKWYSADMMWVFSSGYRYQLGHCKDKDDWEKYQSFEFTHIGYDELVQFEKEQYDNINTRLRTSDPVLQQRLRIRAMSNPFFKREGSKVKVRDPMWVRRLFVDPCRQGKKTIRTTFKRRDGTEFTKTRIYLPATLYDNPDKAFIRQYEMQLADKPEHIREALLYGSWYFTANAYYSNWRENLHVIRPFRIPEHWKRWRSMDWGYKTQGVCLWMAMDEEGNIYVEREFNFRGMQAERVALRIRDYEREMGLWNNERNVSGISGAADTQLWEKRGETAMSKAEEMQRVGVRWKPAEKSRAVNAMRINERLGDHRGGTTLPGLMFFDTCTKCIETLPGIQPDPDDPETPMDGGEDHWHDAVCYGVALASRPAGLPKAPSATSDWGRWPSASRQSRGQYGYGQH